MEGYLQQRNLRDETQWSREGRIQNKSFGPIDLIPGYEKIDDA